MDQDITDLTNFSGAVVFTSLEGKVYYNIQFEHGEGNIYAWVPEADENGRIECDGTSGGTATGGGFEQDGNWEWAGSGNYSDVDVYVGGGSSDTGGGDSSPSTGSGGGGVIGVVE